MWELAFILQKQFSHTSFYFNLIRNISHNNYLSGLQSAGQWYLNSFFLISNLILLGFFCLQTEPIDTTLNCFSEQQREFALELVELKLRLDWLYLLTADALGLRVMVLWGTPLILTKDRLLMRLFDLLKMHICSYCSSRFTKLSSIYLFEPESIKEYLCQSITHDASPFFSCLSALINF